VIAIGLSLVELDQLLMRGFGLLRNRQVDLLGSTMARLEVPPRLSLGAALQEARRAAPSASFAGNDLYRRFAYTSYRTAGGGCGERCEAFEITAWTHNAGKCAMDVPIGVVDTGVNLSHPSLAGAAVTLQTLRSPDRPPSDKDHGTAILSLLVGRADTGIAGVVPRARVLFADAFHGTGQGSRVDAFDLIAALDWLASQGVQVVNLSLSGPTNAHLERAIAGIQARGILVVAASGQASRDHNTGYPARYAGVIAVSAVDHRLRPLRSTARGRHVAFVAPGAGIAVAQGASALRRVEGSSFAAPFVTAAFAMGLGRLDGVALNELLARSAKDLGEPGRDPVYGWGLLQYTAIPPC
jgi:subtilisin family serine protease